MAESRKAKFTPGPWEAAPTGYRVCAVRRDANGNIEGSTYICDTANNKATRTPENAANAKLIAAAPDMAEALQYLLTFVRQYMPKPDGDDLSVFSDYASAEVIAYQALAKAGL